MNIKDFVYCLSKEEAIELILELQKVYYFEKTAIITYGQWFDLNIFKIGDTRLRNILKQLLFDFKNKPSFQVLSRGTLQKQRTCGGHTMALFLDIFPEFKDTFENRYENIFEQ
jgi:hypothetical protein